MYKIWLIQMMNFWRYETINKYNSKIPEVYDFFKITVRKGSGKSIRYEEYIASHYTHINIYTFGNERFLSMDDMLNYVLCVGG